MSADEQIELALWDALNGLCDGILSQEEEHEIAARLEREPEARALYLEIVDLHGEMRWAHRGELADNAVGIVEKRPVRQTRRLVLWSIASAFAAAAAVALVFMTSQRAPQSVDQPVVVDFGRNLPIRKALESPSVPVPKTYVEAPSGTEVATLSSVSGTTWLFAPGEDKVAAGNGLVVRSGTTVVCEDNGGGTLELYDGSRFDMAPGTELTILQAGRQFDLFLGQGHLQASVKPQNKAMTCSTYNAKLEVLGTRFSMSASYLSVLPEPTSISHVVVQEGRVRFANLAGDAIEVSADEMAMVDRNLAPVLSSVMDLRVENLEIARATYGTESSWLDVTTAIRSRVGEHRLLLTGLFNHLQGDPRYHEEKTLRIEYVVNGQRQTANFDEWLSFISKKPVSTIVLPLADSDQPASNHNK